MIELQRKLMGDPVRNAALSRALKKIIVPGKTVVADIGSGTGFLSFLALRLGAKECFLYEAGGSLALSRKIADENGLSSKCHFIHAHSLRVKSPVRADVVISETLGNFPYEEHILETMRDAVRFLKPGGTIIPQQLTSYVIPIVSDRLWKEINIWDGVGFGLNFSAAKNVSLNNMYVKKVLPADLLGRTDAVRQWDTVHFEREISSVRKGSAQWTMERPQTVFGFCVFWTCELVPGIVVTTSPFSAPTHWEQIVLPLFRPFPVRKGETLEAVITSDTRAKVGVHVTWEVSVRNQEKKKVACQKLDMAQGFME
ncbi:MAG: 50S ribosomal protein L11 methyltransferase [Candidatus Peregrinibacteria bacterium]